ncbi:MAG: trypsin-like serine protease [Acidobacteria bacterium]|nr:MAG: trypsin-like serine protease [Acidobacteriota bacterium]
MPQLWRPGAIALAVSVTGASVAARVPPQLERVVAAARPAVVLVQVTRAGGTGHGSGFIYEPSGYILTNHHVIEGATGISVTLSDGRQLPARVVDFKRVEDDDLTLLVDAAVLKVEATGLPTLPLQASRPVQEAQDILVLGFPGQLATDRMSVTRGIVSAVRAGWIETDALIVPGNSGGPILDSSGRVIGLATFIIGYDRRFGGGMWIQNAAALAASARDPNGERSRVINVPGLEYFMPRDPDNRRYSDEHRKFWQVTASDGRSYDSTESVESAGEYYGARRYDAYTLFVTPQVHADYFVDSNGFYDLSTRVDNTWVRSSPTRVTEALLPLDVGKSWDIEERWSRESLNDLAQVAGARPRPSSMSVTGHATIDSVDETVAVPAGTYRRCVRITIRRNLITNQGDRESRTITTWYAPYVGKIKTVRVNGGERFTAELKSVDWRR